jgi:hypothetical protein
MEVDVFTLSCQPNAECYVMYDRLITGFEMFIS